MWLCWDCCDVFRLLLTGLMLPLVGPIASSRWKLQNVMRFPPEIYPHHILQINYIKIHFTQCAYNLGYLYKIWDNVLFLHTASWAYSIWLLERKPRHLHRAIFQTWQEDYKSSHWEKFPLDGNSGLAVLGIRCIPCECGNRCHAFEMRHNEHVQDIMFLQEGHVSPIWIQQWMWPPNNLQENISTIHN